MTTEIQTAKRIYKPLKVRVAPLLATAIREKRDKLKEVGKTLRFPRGAK